MATRLGNLNAASVSWPSINSNSQFYTDIILYPKKPIYFKYCEDLDASVQPGCNKKIWKMYPNNCAGAMYVITFANIKADSDFVALVFKVNCDGLIKPEDIISTASKCLTPVMKMSFQTSCALARWAWYFCVGFYTCATTRLGCTALRAPRWSADYTNYCHYNPIPNDCTLDCDVSCEGEKDDWTFEATLIPAGSCCPCDKQPITLRPVDLDQQSEKAFRYITDVMCNHNGLPSSQLVDTVCRTNNQTGAAYFCGLAVYNAQTPWLNNPPVWSVDTTVYTP